jgi:hypothetical protein
MDCAQAQNLLHGGSLIRACDIVRPRAVAAGGSVLRVQSAFRYPGGEYVDLFFHERPGAEPELSDDGFTMGQLLSMGVDPDATQKRKAFISDVCEEMRVQRRGGMFVAPLGPDPAATLADAAIRLGQACVRIADLSLTHRTRLVSAFGDELEEGLESLDRPFTRGVQLAGRAGRTVTVDYVVEGATRRSALLSMSARNAGRAHDVANDTFTKWFDLQEHQNDLQFVTVLDSQRIGLFREEDLTRLELFSTVVPYPDEADRLRDMVAV